ncbi:carboxypeptidase-like regulatory domain-containing protein [Flavobacterium alkalisoli]|uniref:carboxypeptidase-like regulatory domain-containing protein n=1 Tax=Flavobacterium alkalisoli TaxID=2602769 RepID=UPI003A922F59
MKKTIMLAFITCITISCDCYQVAEGIVIDKETKKPLKNVVVYNKNKPYNKKQTDSLGKFELSGISGGMFGCPPMKVIIEKAGYTSGEVEISSGEEKTIELEKKPAN